MKKVYDFFGGRKYCLAQEILGVLTVLMWFGKISDQSFTFGLSAVIAVYVGGNVIQKVKSEKTV